MIFTKQHSVLFILSLSLFTLSACQPPPSGEATSWKRPYLETKLSQDTLRLPLLMPVEGVKISQIQDTWGAARSAGRKHEGVDIFAKRGTPVLSTTQGIVRRMNENSLGGTVIAYVGNTGNAKTTPPHLHYGIYTSSGAVNPYPYLTGKLPAGE